MRTELASRSDDDRGTDPTKASYGDVLPRLLTLPEVAEALRVSEKTVRRLVARRVIPCVRIGGLLRFDHRDLAQWISARREV
jgi:excisionase family DNA binding protein